MRICDLGFFRQNRILTIGEELGELRNKNKYRKVMKKNKRMKRRINLDIIKYLQQSFVQVAKVSKIVSFIDYQFHICVGQNTTRVLKLNQVVSLESQSRAFGLEALFTRQWGNVRCDPMVACDLGQVNIPFDLLESWSLCAPLA